VKRALVAAISRDNNNNAEPSDYVKHILSKLDAHQVRPFLVVIGNLLGDSFF